MVIVFLIVIPYSGVFFNDRQKKSAAGTVCIFAAVWEMM